MDLAKVLLQLREELAALDAAIISLERLHQGGRRRGRPPEWLAEIKRPAARSGRKRRSGSAIEDEDPE
jgi:hypothetical protein